MASIANLTLDAAAGGLFGLIGTALGRVASFFERRQAFAQEQAKWVHELQLHEMNMRAKAQETEAELALVAQAGSWRGLEASILADAAIGEASRWVVNTLRLVRPTLTFLLWLITGWIFAITQDGTIVEAAVFAATAATLWWFGDRAPRSPSTSPGRV
ncbi:hypothetical protein GCM10007853_12550 [Algimonas ampicilliniresistens]|jgi:hypothetical protein|uniref:Uncharacterized protein n=1 Tax=Algimonas ampicilliniresistens TaxID=1298735 RepID=A0ABQ5V765_9PROT|nr:hypothetical protein [Algimonas ampicilliniresistens]GLQ23381.1 hypothetical protein GCM10007853_12550 [Algimonas ampicilliniresistens]